MKPPTKTELSQLLSEYLDGELNEQQVRDVKTLLSQDAGAREELDELRALKNLISSKAPLKPSHGFYTRLSAELERRKREEDNLLPFPRRYVPAVAVSAAVVLVVLGVLVFQQRSTLVDYVSKQSERVQKAVEDNVLKGTLMPLFTHIDKNQALQFAMFGTLPLDAKAETELRVSEDSARGYTIDVDKKGDRKTPTVTMQEFVDEVGPTRVQLQIIDSLLDLGRSKLEGSVLVAEDKAMAVNPELSRWNKVMLSGIAAALEPNQRVRFERFLQSKKAPYTLAGGGRRPETPERIYYSMRAPERASSFVVFSPETVLVSRIEIDLDSLRRHASQMAEMQGAVAGHVNSLIRRMAERDMALSQPHRVVAPRVRVYGDSESFTIQVGTGWEGMPTLPMDPWVRPRMAQQVGRQGRHSSGVNVGMGEDDGSLFFSVDFDSLMVRMGREAERGAEEAFRGDPRMHNRIFPDERALQQFLDSVYQGKKHKTSKLDSLMNEMDRRERERMKKERELPQPKR
jgi:hypothetical protein